MNKYSIKGITLISLVIIIIILIILAGISVNLLIGNNGILIKSKTAKEESEKQTATELIYLKIANTQILSYSENKEFPNLQYLASTLCKDNDIEYVLKQSKIHASLEEIDVSDVSSIYTKLKEYPYEFEINSSLQLASINGIEVSSYPEYKSYIADDSLKEILDLANISINIEDIISKSFLEKISTSKEAVKKILANDKFQNAIINNLNAGELLSYLGCDLVPILYNNSNVIYSSQYDNSSYAAYKAFSTSGYWCSESGLQNNAYIGYNFQKNVNIKIAKIYNGASNDYKCKQVKLQCSSDNTTWIDASDIITLDNSNKNNYIINNKIDDEYQYWRIFILNSYHSNYCASQSIQFYGT